ncbi:hypothetical protein OH76DRAFT_1478522 [Lentinus brumalis]|uniref:Uncharacterized protein n=1 Tax=Lentinus brumalis TaxID=2498619 RepID=A0A371DR74_9APHY|nr:hypothetical protein OH76DRAFT_1478522 [Polyporus brumalis]
MARMRYDKHENRWYDEDGKPVKRCIDESDSEPEEDTRPWKRHQGPLPAPPVSVGSFCKSFTKHEDILPIFTLETRTTLLQTLMGHRIAAPVVQKTMETMYADAVVAFVASVHAKLKEATCEMDRVHVEDEIDMNDYIRVVQPFLEDVVLLSRMPAACRGAAKGAWELLLAIVSTTDPGEERSYSQPGERAPFDEAADELGLFLVQRQNEEEGVNFEFKADLEKLQEIKGTMALWFRWESESWFPKTMKALEGFAQERSASGN